ncbi:citrate transporter [Anaerosporomusa subterranea]|uniref:Citrate transporter n=1 Tax=Anaerosporomusa subterranea TaxID=1794912 RepID=A0A154BRS1_ANASB|nr:citrate transporter [Anaerosporomusa subterranea]KYZ76631.1 citrate transporter [Anaerosporomusa subterranea]
MIDSISGILLLISFIGLIIYCMKGGNLLVGFIATSLLWCIIGRVPLNIVVTDIFQTSVENYGKTIAIIVFGAWFGRMLVDTGIAGYIIKKTVELAGDKPLVSTLLLSIVCALIFTSAFGVGSVMAIGMIVLPILFSLGIDKKTAVGAYLLAVAAGMYLNIAYVSQFFAVFKNVKYNDNYIQFAVIATIVHIAVMVAFIIFNYMRAQKGGRARAWAVGAVSEERETLGWYCMIVPFIPIVMVSFFKWQPIPSFLLGIFLGLLLTRNMVSYNLAVEKIQKTLYDGIADSGLLIGMLYSVNIFQAAAKQVSPILQNLMGGIIPTSSVLILIAVCVLAPLALFRGPLMIWGSGIALVSIFQAMGVFSEMFLFALFLIPPVAIVASACPTQSWTMWGLSYAKLEPKQYIKTNLPWAWLILIIVEVLAYVMIGNV